MTKQAWGRGVEILAILPATLVLMPLGAGAAAGISLALVQDISAGFSGMALAPIFGLWLAFVVPIVALVALWGAIVMSSFATHVARSLRIATGLALVFGLASVGYWMWVLSRESGSTFSARVWIAFLAGPVVVGGRYLIWLGLQQPRVER